MVTPPMQISLHIRIITNMIFFKELVLNAQLTSCVCDADQLLQNLICFVLLQIHTEKAQTLSSHNYTVNSTSAKVCIKTLSQSAANPRMCVQKPGFSLIQPNEASVSQVRAIRRYRLARDSGKGTFEYQ